MAMTLRQSMQDLKQSLQVDEDFGAISSKFFDITNFDEFIALGKFKENELVETLVEQAAKKIFGEEVGILLRLQYVKKFGFYHGSVIVQSMPGVVIYFESIKMGMLTVSTSFKGDVSYLRFTADIVMDGGFTAKTSKMNN